MLFWNLSWLCFFSCSFVCFFVSFLLLRVLRSWWRDESFRQPWWSTNAASTNWWRTEFNRPGEPRENKSKDHLMLFVFPSSVRGDKLWCHCRAIMSPSKVNETVLSEVNEPNEVSSLAPTFLSAFMLLSYFVYFLFLNALEHLVKFWMKSLLTGRCIQRVHLFILLETYFYISWWILFRWTFPSI